MLQTATSMTVQMTARQRQLLEVKLLNEIYPSACFQRRFQINASMTDTRFRQMRFILVIGLSHAYNFSDKSSNTSVSLAEYVLRGGFPDIPEVGMNFRINIPLIRSILFRLPDGNYNISL